MSTMIPLMGKQPDVVNALAGGARAAGVANQVQHSNRLRDLYASQGAGILAGDPSAMNALAGLDPAQAHTMQMDRQNQQRADARLAISQEQLQMQRDAVARALAEAEDQTEAQREAQEAVAMGNKAMAALQAGDERAWGMMTREFTGGTPLPMTREGVATLQSIVTGSADYMAALPQQRGPLSGPGKVQADIDAGLLPAGTPLRTPQVQVNTGDQVAPVTQGSPSEIAGSVPDGSGRLSFGLGGIGRNIANAGSDFLTGQEVFPETGENTRFFKSLEEELLVPLAQAYPRQPANQLMNRLQKLLPNVNTLEGAQSAYRELLLMQDRYQRDLQQVQAARGGTASQQNERQKRVLGLQSSLVLVDEAIRRLAPQGGNAEIRPEVADRLKAYQ